MRRPLRATLLLIAALAALAPRPAVADDADARRRFFEEAPAAWAKAKNYADGLTVEGEERFYTTERAPKKLLRDQASPVKYVKSGESTRFEVVRADGSASASVVAPGGFFQLEKASATSPHRVELSWPKQRSALLNLTSRFILRSRLASYGVAYFEAELLDVVAYRIDHSFTLLSLAMPFSIDDDTSLEQLIKDPAYQITSVANVVQDGRELVKVEFEYRPADATAPHLQSGWHLFDPARRWARVSSEFVATTGRSYVDIDYGDDDEGGYPSIKRAQLRHASPEGEDKAGAQVLEFTVKSWRRQAIADGEFQLAAFEVADGPAPTSQAERPPLMLPTTIQAQGRGVAKGAPGE